MKCKILRPMTIVFKFSTASPLEFLHTFRFLCRVWRKPRDSPSPVNEDRFSWRHHLQKHHMNKAFSHISHHWIESRGIHRLDGRKWWPVKHLSLYMNALAKEAKSPFSLGFYLEEFYLGEFYLSKLRDFDSQLWITEFSSCPWSRGILLPSALEGG